MKSSLPKPGHSLLIKELSAKETWPIRHRVMWPDRALEYVKLPDDETGMHYGLFVDNHLTSVISLFVEGTSAQFRKFATEKSEQGNGYGSQLLRYILAQARTNGIERIWCNSRVEKAGYYTRFGLTATEVHFSRGDQEYVIMECIFKTDS